MVEFVDRASPSLESIEKVKIRFPSSTIWLLGLSAIFASLVAASIAYFGVNFPIWDEWDTPGLMFVKLHDGTIDLSRGRWNWGYWIAQHNESRKFFPRLILVSLASVTNWNIKVEMFLILGLMAAIALTLYALSRLTLTRTPRSRLNALAIVANLLVFSLIQYDNFLFGLQVCVLLSLSAIVLGLLVAQTRFPLWLKTLVGILLCLVSTYSFSNGVLSWVVVFPAIFFPETLRWREIGRRLFWATVWIATMAVNLGFYFRNYVKPPDHPGWDEAVRHPLEAVRYFFVFLGGPLGFHDIPAATVVGAIVFGVWSAMVVALLWNSATTLQEGKSGFENALEHRWDLSELNRAKSWIMLGGYSILSGLFAALGRVGFGIEQAISPRYTTFSLYAIVSAIYLGALLAERDKTVEVSSPRRRWLSRGVYLLLGIGLVLHLKTSAFALDGMYVRKTDTLHAQACTLVIDVLRDDDCLRRYVYPDPDRLYDHAIAINDLGYLSPPLLESDDVRDFSASLESETARGFFDALVPLSGDRYQVRGWAELTERSLSAADLVLLTYTTDFGAEKPFAIIDDREFRPDALHAGLPRDTQLGWSGEFARSQLPNRSLVVKAWAFDATTARAHLLTGSFELTPTP
ncbi:hypothetical protein AY599_24490 [Leptolyngbya valderiana BDU 20041]|nr:hypothetical protein AY599_24490 [Leptolyngbya valderiana BDU 20041]